MPSPRCVKESIDITENELKAKKDMTKLLFCLPIRNTSA